MGNIASRFKWVFGVDPDGGSAHVLASTGAGVAFNTHGWGENFSFAVESNDSAMSYQIRVGRTSSGPWRSLSSGSLSSTTGSVDYVQMPGPLMWVSPLVDALGSTTSHTVIRMTAVEA